jgi:hypothetical protein
VHRNETDMSGNQDNDWSNDHWRTIARAERDARKEADAEVARLKAELAKVLLQLTNKLAGERAATISRLEVEAGDLMLQLGRAERELSMATSLAAGAVTINTPSGDPGLAQEVRRAVLQQLERETLPDDGAVASQLARLESRLLGANRGLRRRLDLLEQLPHNAPPIAGELTGVVRVLLTELKGLEWSERSGYGDHDDSCSWVIAVKAGRSYLDGVAEPVVVQQGDRVRIAASLTHGRFGAKDGPEDVANRNALAGKIVTIDRTGRNGETFWVLHGSPPVPVPFLLEELTPAPLEEAAK